MQHSIAASPYSRNYASEMHDKVDHMFGSPQQRDEHFQQKQLLSNFRKWEMNKVAQTSGETSVSVDDVKIVNHESPIHSDSINQLTSFNGLLGNKYDETSVQYSHK